MSKLVMSVAVLALSACMHTNAVRLDPRVSYAPVDPYDVVVYLEEGDVPYEYQPIALVHARGDDDWTDQADMIEAMREEAAKLGAHGIIMEWIEEPYVWERVLDEISDVDVADRRGKAVAIRAVGS